MRKSWATKITTWLLTITMVFVGMSGGMLGGSTASAAVFSGKGTATSPYLVGTAEQLNQIRGSYLNANLYFKQTAAIDLSGYAAGAGWTPIGNGNAQFYGHYDGDGKTITGLKIDGADDEVIGLFGSIGSGSSITGVSLVGVSVAGNDSVGGLVGWNDGGDITSSSVTGTVTATSVVGGLVGSSIYGTIQDSHAEVEVTGDVIVGGLTGIFLGQIDNSYATGNVRGNKKVGGLVGNFEGTVHNSYATGDVSVIDDMEGTNLGGLIGYNEQGSISGSYATGNVNGAEETGGLVGRNSEGKIEDSHASGIVSGTLQIGGLVGTGYKGKISNSYASGDVDASEYEDSQTIGGLIGYNSGEVRNAYATGNVFGGSRNIGGLVGNNSGWDGGATIYDSYATGNVEGSESIYVGGLVGFNDGVINNTYATGNVNANSPESNVVGGLIGQNMNGNVSRSYATGDVAGSYEVGGLIGATDKYGFSTPNPIGTISIVYATGNVRGIENVGGLIGMNSFGEINDAYARGKVNGTTYVGGLIGGDAGGVIEHAYATGEVTGSDKVGGLIGIQTPAWDKTGGFTTNSFYDIETTGQSVSSGGAGQPTSAMKVVNTYVADAAHRWDFSAVWDMDGVHEGGYPFLQAIQAFLDYDGNDNTGGTAPPSHSYMPGATVAVYSGTTDLVRAGYVFKGWSIEQDGSGRIYKPADPFTIASSTTLYAKWVIPSDDATLTSSIGTVSTDGTSSENITDIPYGTTLATLKSAITLSDVNASFEIYDADGSTVATELSTGKKVIVTASDGTTQVTYTVTMVPNNKNDMLSFNFNEQTKAATINTAAHTVAIEVTSGTSLNGLIAYFTLSGGATAKVGGTNQVNGVTTNDFRNPVIYVVRAEDGSTQNWTVTATVAKNDEKDITSFSLPQQTKPATIDADAHTVDIEVAYGTNRNGLVATFALSAGATAKVGTKAQVSGVTTNNFNSQVIYVVQAEDGSTQNWTVYVSIALRTAKDITAYSFTSQTKAATIDAVNHTVAIEVKYGTDVTNLIATFTLSGGASAKAGSVTQKSGTTANNFTSPVTYVVQAEDGSRQNWTVTVTVALNSAKDITSFSLAEQTKAATINKTAHTVAIEVAKGTSLNGLVATFGLSVGASAKVGSVDQASGTTSNDFTSPVIYVVKAEDGSTQNWTVTVTAAKSSAKDITSFSFAAQIGAATIDAAAHTVAIEVANGTSLNGLVATFGVSAGATAKVSGADQVSGTTANDFTSPVTYVVKAADDSTQNWSVTVTVAVNSAKEITSFSFDSQTGAAVIDAAAHTVAIEVAHGTSLNGLVATFGVSAGATAKVSGADQVSGTTANDFTSPVTYVVKAADDSTQNWSVTVTVAVNSANDITSFSFAEQTGAATIDAAAHTVAIEVAYGTILNGLVATFGLSAGATAKVSGADQVSGTTANDFMSPVTYVVKAADGSTQEWTVTVSVAANNANDITSFSFAEQTGAATIDAAAHTVAIEVANGTSLNGLVATFGVSAGATAKVGGTDQVSGTTANNFTSPVIYVVKAVDGSTQNWSVTVTVAVNSANDITSFSFSEQTGAATIDAAALTVAIEVAHGTSLNGLVATFGVSAGATAKVGGTDQVSGTTANNFTSPVIYVVKAVDGSTQNWSVTVTVAVNSANDITSFSFSEQTGAATIDAAALTVAIEVAHGTSLNGLVATFGLSAGATAKVGGTDQVSGTTANNFTSPVIYVVKAVDGSTQNWSVTVTVAVNSANEITSFSFSEQTGAATIDAAAHTVAIEVAYGTSLNGLVATFGVSAGATAKVGGTDQVSGTTENNFTSPVIYVVKAADGSTQNWSVTVTVAVNSANDITSFSFSEQTGAATIDTAAHTVAIEVAYGTNLNGLVATFGLSAGATAKVSGADQVSGTTANDFTIPVTYVVKAADDSTQNWTVTTTVAPSNVATLTSTIGTVSRGGTANEKITDIPYGTTLTALKAAITPAAGATFEIYDTNGTTVATTLATGKKVIVTAQDGTTKVTYTVQVNAGPPSGGGGFIPPTNTQVSSTDGNLTLPAGQAGEVSLENEIVITIPANATDKEVIIKISKVTDLEELLANHNVPASAVFEVVKNFPENFANPVTITIRFNTEKLEGNQLAVVYYYDELKKDWVAVPDGKVEGNHISVMVNHFTKFAVFAKGQSVTPQPPVILNDIDGHWAKAAIKQAVGSGIVSGYPDGTFKPDHAVTRAEFTVMLMNTLKPQGAGAALTFTDAADIGSWAKKAVSQAVQAGYIHGYEDGTFRPDEAITRAEMAMMIAKASGLSWNTNDTTDFADDQDIPVWAKGAIAAIKKLGFIHGKGSNEFDPNASTTRAEAVTVLLKLLAQKSK